MLLRDRCYFCERQLNDRDPIVQNSVTHAVAHAACVKARPAERTCESPAPCAARSDPPNGEPK